MKFDKKTWIIIILVLMLSIIGLIYYFKGDSNKSANEILEKNNIELQHQRDSLKLERDSLKVSSVKYDSLIVYYSNILSKYKEQNNILTKQNETLTIDLNGKIKEYNVIKSNIKELEANPIFRTDTTLLTSLKNKLK